MTEGQNYFPTQISLPHQLLNEINSLKQSLITKIQKGEVEISQHLQFKKKNHAKDKSTQNQQYRKRIKQLDNIKQELSGKLKKIQNQQKQIRKMSKNIQKPSNKSRLQKSVVTEEQKQRIIQIKKQKKQFQQKMKQRINTVIEKIQQDQKQMQAQKSFKNDLKRKQRIIKLIQKRTKLQQSRGKTLQLLRNSQTSTKANNYVYIRNKQLDRSIQSERKRYAQMMLSQKKQKMKTNFSQIRQHSIEHQKIMNERKEIHLFQFKEDQIRKRTKTIVYQSQFTKKVKQEKRMQKIQQMRKLNAKRQIRDKITNFSDYLTENFKPKVTQQSSFVPKKQNTALQGLSHEQVLLKGKQYLFIAKKKAKKISPMSKNKYQIDDIRDSAQALPTSSTMKYPDYLRDLKVKSIKQQNPLQRILKQKKKNKKHIQEAIRWVKKNQQSKKIGGHKVLMKNQIKNAFQKIQLLKSIYQSSLQINE